MKKLLVKRSKTENKIPLQTDLDYGELALNYFSGKETIYIKNSANNIIDFPNKKVVDTINNTLISHVNNKNNPHEITKAQVGLSNVDNTSDVNKPISLLQQDALNQRVATTEIVDNLTTASSDRPLSAKQGIELNKKLDDITGGAVADLSSLIARVISLEEEMDGAIAFADIVINDSI